MTLSLIQGHCSAMTLSQSRSLLSDDLESHSRSLMHSDDLGSQSRSLLSDDLESHSRSLMHSDDLGSQSRSLLSDDLESVKVVAQ